MPEGPEIRTAADKLQSALATLPVVEIYFAFARLKPFQDRMQGRRVLRVETRGKAILIHTDNRLSIYSHNQLYGRWQIRRAYDFPQTKRQLRLAIHNEKKSALLYSASDVDVLTPEQIAKHPYLSRLGPDILSSDIGCVLEQLQSKTHRRRRFSSLLLDQRFIAGIGNYLRSEILFVAGLSPHLRPVDCSTPRLERLAEAASAVSRQSYLHSGVTNDLDSADVLKALGQTHGQYRHWVFGRANEPCRRCGTRIVQDIAASRRIYFCPVCQPVP